MPVPTQYYAGGENAALSAFGLTKIALKTPQEAAAFMAARRGRPTGLAAIQAQATAPAPGSVPPAPKREIPLGAAPAAPMQLQQGLGGGPGAAAGYGSRALPVETPLGYGEASLTGQLPSRKLPTAMTGAGSIPGQAAQAERLARAAPMKYNLPNKLAAFLLPTA